MGTRVALLSIIVQPDGDIRQMNALLHEAAACIIGRMGIPYRRRDINIISVAIDAPQDVTAALSGKIGRLRGISVKTMYAK